MNTFRQTIGAVARCAALVLPLVTALVLAGCYTRPEPPCAFQCGMEEGSEGACPDGYTCNADNACVRDDLDPRINCETGELPTVDAAPEPDA